MTLDQPGENLVVHGGRGRAGFQVTRPEPGKSGGRDGEADARRSRFRRAFATRALVSYSSSHEKEAAGRTITAIYLAELTLPP